MMWGDRKRLPDRRISEVVEYDFNGIRYYGTIGYYADGTPGEAFLQGGKAGSAVEAMARDAAVFASLALQYGCPIEVIRAAITRLDQRDGGGAAGAAGALFDFPLLSTETARYDTASDPYWKGPDDNAGAPELQRPDDVAPSEQREPAASGGAALDQTIAILPYQGSDASASLPSDDVPESRR